MPVWFFVQNLLSGVYKIHKLFVIVCVHMCAYVCIAVDRYEVSLFLGFPH